MTFTQWKKEFKKRLKALPKGEVESIADYYEEMYTDKAEAGLSESEILAEFGTPEECAERIKSEGKAENEASAQAMGAAKNTASASMPLAPKIIALTFLTLFIIIPFAAVLISAIAALGASAIATAASTLAGVLIAAMGVIYIFVGAGFAPALALIGGGIAAAGICTILAICLAVITKYAAISSYKLLVYVYRGRRDGR